MFWLKLRRNRFDELMVQANASSRLSAQNLPLHAWKYREKILISSRRPSNLSEVGPTRAYFEYNAIHLGIGKTVVASDSGGCKLHNSPSVAHSKVWLRSELNHKVELQSILQLS